MGDCAYQKRQFSGHTFVVDSVEMNLFEMHSHLLSCGFSSTEAAQYVQLLIADAKAKNGSAA